jgi:signal transduction histidine kinase
VARVKASRLAWWDGSALNLLGDTGIAVLFTTLGWTDAVNNKYGLIPLGVGTMLTVAALALAVLLRRRFPMATAAVAMFAQIAAGIQWGVPMGCYTVASRRGNTWVTWLVAAASFVTVTVAWGLPFIARSVGDAAFLGGFLVATPTILGLWVAQRRVLVASLHDRAEQSERERDLRAAGAVAEERARIARELHDVVAHRVSQIAVQAGALAITSDGRTADVAEGIRGTSTAALEEMRELLGVLRHGENSTPLHPAPTLDGLARLVDDAVAAGQPVRADLPEHLPTVPGSTGRAIYRLVQEALTNAAKHAPGAAVKLTLGDVDGELAVSVRNAPGLPAALWPAALPESGFGLTGMRERVKLAGGRLDVGPTPDGGYLVIARFPGRSA